MARAVMARWATRGPARAVPATAAAPTPAWASKQAAAGVWWEHGERHRGRPVSWGCSACCCFSAAAAEEANRYQSSFTTENTESAEDQKGHWIGLPGSSGSFSFLC